MLFFSDPSDVSCPQGIEHSYSNASASTTGTNQATTDAEVQKDMTLSDIDKILIGNKNLKEKLDVKDTLFKNIFIEKVTKSDESVRKYTGLPNLEIFNSIKKHHVYVHAKDYFTKRQSTLPFRGIYVVGIEAFICKNGKLLFLKQYVHPFFGEPENNLLSLEQ